MSSESEIWSEVLSLLGERFERKATYNLWFSELVLQKLVDDKAYLQTPNTYKKKILEQKFMDDILLAFHDIMGFDVKVYIISVETKPFDEQYFELLEKDAKEQLLEEQKRKGITYIPDYTLPDPVEEEPELVEPRRFRGKFKLSKKNLMLPKVYNAEDDKLEDLSLVKYLEQLGNTDGMLRMSSSTPEYLPSYTFENFVVGDSNRMAFATCYAVAQYPGKHCNPLFIYGPTGIGKTHLLYAIADHVGKNFPSFNIVYCTSEDFTNELISAISHKTQAEFREKYRSADVLMIDDIQFIGGKEATQLEFFNTFNTLYESNKQIIVASDRPPKDIEVLEKRIRSRFESSAIMDIKTPDPELREAIIRRKAVDMNIKIPNTAISYIAMNVKENVRQIEGIMKHLGIYSLLKKEPITEELIRSIVGNVATAPIEISPDKIIDAVVRHTNVSREDILGKKHTKNVVFARHLCSYLLRSLTDLTLQEIGRVIGRHHSTVHDSINLIEEEKKEDTVLEEQIKTILKDLGQQ